MTKKEQTIEELCIENDKLQMKIKLLEDYLKAKTDESLQLYKELSEMQEGLNQLAFNFANTLIMREINVLTDDEFVVTINNKKFIELVKQVREQIK